MIDYSKVRMLNSTFLNRWGKDSAYDGRIHPNFNITDVVSGRTSCSDPNLQQVPRQKDIRCLYHAEKGKVFFEADYSQLELRIAADFANEKTMLRIYREDGDIHTETAKTFTNGADPTKEERNRAKAVNFGFLYGMGAKGFIDYAYNSYDAIFTLKEAQHYRELFFIKYPGLLPWHEKQRELARALGGVANKFGRFRKLPDIYSNDFKKRGSAERISINTPVQGTGSDILLCSAIQIDKELGKQGLSIVGSVHDSILGEFYEEDVEWMVPEIKRIMAHPKLMDEFGVTLKVKLDCDVGVGKWGTH
jgi:DNA polymerase-1